ncbi:hypothetical protein ACGFOU_19955 [Streptomyces sp. NPDC048595]|uniref:hypothetical protein n=1 Tax=Streptomyces sp. NPDC048595 TaxID=3365576 RepID=UPI003710B1F0
MAVTVEPERFDLGSVRSALLDRIQVNLAVLADHHHGPGAHLRLGAPLRFRTWDGADGLPTVDAPLPDRLAVAPKLLGLRVVRQERAARGELCRTIRAAVGVRYIVADAFQLPWLPYYRRAHTTHGFLLAAGPDGWHVTDAYLSETPWGTAAPGHWVLSADELAGIESAEVIELAPAAACPVAEPPPTQEADEAAVTAYLAAYDACADRARAVERLTGETWLLVRARKLHAAYRAFARRTGETEAERAQLRAWDEALEWTRLAHRRVSRGRAEPPGVVDRLREVLAADRTVFGAAPAAPAASPSPDEDH